MQAFRLITSNESEEINDKYAFEAYTRFNMLCYDVELTYISDSLGTTFFLRWGKSMRIDLDDYINVVQAIRRCIINAYKRTNKIVRIEALD